MALSEKLGWTFASFGDYLRREAQRLNLDHTSREVLQSLGNQSIAGGWEDFCSAVLKDAGWQNGDGLVIDGIRHIQATEVLRRLVAPLELFLVYVSTDKAVRKVRLRERSVSEDSLIEILEKHDTETQVKEILEIYADLVVDGNRDLKEIIRFILSWMDARTL